MSLTEKFREAAIEQSIGRNTAIYLHADAARGFSPLDVPAPKAFLS